LLPIELYYAKLSNPSTSAWLRRRRLPGSCFPFILQLQHRPAVDNRWFGLTLTIDPFNGVAGYIGNTYSVIDT